MTGSIHKLQPRRWRLTRVLAALAWLAMVGMPVMMPAHANAMAIAAVDAAPMQHDSGSMDHSRSMAVCCQDGAGQHAGNPGCHCAATCSAGFVLPATHAIGDLWSILPELHILEPSVTPQSSIPPYRPPRA